MGAILDVLLAPLFQDRLRFLDIAKEIAIETFLADVVTVHIPAQAGRSKDWDENQYILLDQARLPVRRPVLLTAILYYSWGNRGPDSIRVWLPCVDYRLPTPLLVLRYFQRDQ